MRRPDVTGSQDALGGFIGFNCAHVYPYSTHTKLNFLAPDNLKGADMLMYEIFKQLGLRVHFRPTIEDPGYCSCAEGDALPIIGRSLESQTWDGADDSYLEEVHDQWAGRDNSDAQDADTPYIDFLWVHWLNDFNRHKEPQITRIVVSARVPPLHASNFIARHAEATLNPGLTRRRSSTGTSPGTK